MRAQLLAILLVGVALAGCTDDRQWAGIAEAWMYKDSALVEVQLHRGSASTGASADTARAGMGQVEAIEDAVATLRLRNGTNATFALAGWTFDRENDTAAVPLDVTRFDAFRLNLTFVMKDGTRLTTSELASWSEQYRRPYHSTLRVNSRATDSQLTLSIYEIEEGARELRFDSVVENGTLKARPVTAVASWRVVGEASGAAFEDASPPSTGATVRATLPYTGITRAEPRFTLVLDEGDVISDRDVDGDVFPEDIAFQRRFLQQN